MSTIRDNVSLVRSSFKLVSSDNSLSDRYVANELRNNALMLIRRDLNKRRLYSSDNIFTTIPCLEMEQCSLAECCDYTSPCTIARSVSVVPKILDNIYGLTAQGVFSVDSKVKFEYTDATRYANYKLIYPDGKKRFWWKQNGHLYITDPDIELVKLIACFEEDVPLSLLQCDNPPDCLPNPLDNEFKCPGYLVPDVLSMTRDTLLKTYKRSKPDSEENDQDTSV